MKQRSVVKTDRPDPDAAAMAVESVSTCVNTAIRRAGRRLGQIYDDALEPCGLRGTQYGLMTQIHRGQGATMRMLAESMVMDLSALGHTLKPLVRDGLVELRVDENDRRSKRVHLTADGKHKWAEARQIWVQLHGRFDRAYGAAQATQLRAALDLIASAGFAEQLKI